MRCANCLDAKSSPITDTRFALYMYRAYGDVGGSGEDFLRSGPIDLSSLLVISLNLNHRNQKFYPSYHGLKVSASFPSNAGCFPV